MGVKNRESDIIEGVGLRKGREGCAGETTYVDVILKFDTSRAVELYTFQGLAHNIIRLSLRLLSGLDYRGFIQITTIVDIQLVECILERENLALIQLRETPTERNSS